MRTVERVFSLGTGREKSAMVVMGNPSLPPDAGSKGRRIMRHGRPRRDRHGKTIRFSRDPDRTFRTSRKSSETDRKGGRGDLENRLPLPHNGGDVRPDSGEPPGARKGARKQPEIFCLTLSIRRSRSARLFVNGTVRSIMKARMLSLRVSRRERSFWALVFLGRPRRYSGPLREGDCPPIPGRSVRRSGHSGRRVLRGRKRSCGPGDHGWRRGLPRERGERDEPRIVPATPPGKPVPDRGGRNAQAMGDFEGKVVGPAIVNEASPEAGEEVRNSQ